jgi:hypothetical protein
MRSMRTMYAALSDSLSYQRKSPSLWAIVAPYDRRLEPPHPWLHLIQSWAAHRNMPDRMRHQDESRRSMDSNPRSRFPVSTVFKTIPTINKQPALTCRYTSMRQVVSDSSSTRVLQIFQERHGLFKGDSLPSPIEI